MEIFYRFLIVYFRVKKMEDQIEIKRLFKHIMLIYDL